MIGLTPKQREAEAAPPTDREILADLARVKAVFDLSVITAAMGALRDTVAIARNGETELRLYINREG